jgi:TPP-dependent pyruvate/acetoin dehydrogenase alpha subunit
LTADLNEHDALSVAAEDEAAGFLKGLPLAEVLRGAETPGRSKSSALKHEGLRGHNFLPPVQGTPAQLQVACGVALAWQAKWPGNVVAVFCNGGSAPAESWKEVLTFASLHQLPLLLMVHEPGGDPGQFEAVAKSSLVHGVPLLTVDGNDAVAIYRVVFESLSRARQGRGPTLIACRTDLMNHDLPEDAIRRMELYLERKGNFDKGLPRRIGLAFHKKLASAVELTAAGRLRLKSRQRKQG